MNEDNNNILDCERYQKSTVRQDGIGQRELIHIYSKAN